MNHFGLNIKAIREYWELSQKEFGWLVNASRGMIMQYEQRGSKPKNETVSRIVKLLGISKDILFNTEIKREDFPEMSQSTITAIENYRAFPDEYKEIADDEDLLTVRSKRQNVSAADIEKNFRESEKDRPETLGSANAPWIYTNKKLDDPESPFIGRKLEVNEPEPTTYLDQRRAAMLQEKEIWFPVMQSNTRLKEQSEMQVYNDDPEAEVPLAFLPQTMYPGCDWGERAFGNSMYPRIVNQGFALGKVIDKRYIKFGELYGLHFKEGGGPPVVKYVHACEDNDTCVILISDNKHVKDQVVQKEEITFMFRVLYIVNPA